MHSPGLDVRTAGRIPAEFDDFTQQRRRHRIVFVSAHGTPRAHRFEYIVRDPGESGTAGISRLSDFPGPVEALRFYQKPRASLDGGAAEN
jgi:hypothetical protein